MTNTGFLLDNEKGWLSSSLFFHSLIKIGINVDQYYVPAGMILAPEEVSYYASALIEDLQWEKPNRLRSQEIRNTDHWQYAMKISKILKTWGENKHVVHVV